MIFDNDIGGIDYAGIVTDEVKSFWVWTCPDRTISSASCDLGVLQIRSITVFSSTKADEIVKIGTECKIGSQVHECERRISECIPHGCQCCTILSSNGDMHT